MKYLITFLMLLNYGYAQDKKADSLLIPTTGIFRSGLGYGPDSNRVTEWDNGTIQIRGDTMTAIRHLLSSLKSGGEREMEAWGKVGYYMRQCKELIRLNDQILKLDRQITKDRIAKVKQMQATLDNSTRQTKELLERIDKLMEKLKL